MDNLPVIFSLYSIQCIANDTFPSDVNTVWLHNLYAPWQISSRTNCMLSRRLHAYSEQCVIFFYFFFRWKHICERECTLSKLGLAAVSSPSSLSISSPWTSALPLSSLLLSPLLQSKLEDLSHHPRFSSNLVGSKVASWAWAGSRWLHAQGDQAKALQVLTPPLPWVPGWGGSGSGNLPELSGMTSRLPLHHPLLCSHMAPAMGALSWGSDLRKINCARAGEGKPHSLGMSAREWILSLTN